MVIDALSNDGSWNGLSECGLMEWMKGIVGLWSEQRYQIVDCNE